MRFKSFRIRNFRGIQDTTIKFDSVKSLAINTLVGLNESGKTTVLEAINHFRSNPNLLIKDPNLKGRGPSDYQKMLPISQRSLFDGEIAIIASLELGKNDKKKIDNFLRENFGFVKTKPVEKFRISHSILYSDSQHEETRNNWDLNFSGYKSNRKNAKLISLKNDEWLQAAKYVEEMLPMIVYFPSELFKFPDRIVIEDPEEFEEHSEWKNDFYCEVLSDILKSINPNLNLDDHLLGRAKSEKLSDGENLEALLFRLEQQLKTTIFTEWKKIFTNTPDYNFKVTLNKKNNQYGLEIKILTKDGLFSINERSAGFRWFFAFIMITRFRLNREENVLFLFDEPAANLHPNAQVQLIKSFESISNKASILYSTHSHYLINPLWLENTHIVQNQINNNSFDDLVFDFNPVNSQITITPYRQFVGQNPNQYYYYQPIHESLDYSPSPLEFPDSVILVEGKTDFFCIKHILDLGMKEDIPKIFPGGGSGSLDVLISLLYGWGKHFVILLDSDISGNNQKERYEKKYELIIENKLFTLEDINPNWQSYEIENMFSIEDKEKIRQEFYPDNDCINKKQLSLAIQELIHNKINLEFSTETTSNFSLIISTLHEKLKEQVFLDTIA